MERLSDIFQLPQLWFYVFGGSAVVLALAVVLSKNIVHCAMYLATAFAVVAGMYFLLDAGFLAAIQVLIYVGAVTVLILFAILLSQKMFGGRIIQHNSQSIPALAIVAVLTGVLIKTVAASGLCCMKASEKAMAGTAEVIGFDLLGPYVLPFEIASVVLLVAMIGAIIIARKD